MPTSMPRGDARPLVTWYIEREREGEREREREKESEREREKDREREGGREGASERGEGTLPTPMPRDDTRPPVTCYNPSTLSPTP